MNSKNVYYQHYYRCISSLYRLLQTSGALAIWAPFHGGQLAGGR